VRDPGAPPVPADDHTNAPAPQQLDRLLDLHTRELNLRAREMDVRLQELTNAHVYSERALQAQLQDREADRRHQRGEKNSWYIFVGVLFFALVAAMGIALFTGHEDFARELLRAVLYVVPAGAGGYFAGKHKERNQEKPSQ
jgi:hypothetical protein